MGKLSAEAFTTGMVLLHWHSDILSFMAAIMEFAVVNSEGRLDLQENKASRQGVDDFHFAGDGVEYSYDFTNVCFYGFV